MGEKGSTQRREIAKITAELLLILGELVVFALNGVIEKRPKQLRREGLNDLPPLVRTGRQYPPAAAAFID